MKYLMLCRTTMWKCSEHLITFASDIREADDADGVCLNFNKALQRLSKYYNLKPNYY